MNNIAFILLAALLISQTMTQVTIPTLPTISVIDIVGPLTTTAFGCLANDGHQNVIVRAYSLDNGGSVDPNAVQTLINAQNANFGTSFIYMVICQNGDAISQVNSVVNSI